MASDVRIFLRALFLVSPSSTSQYSVRPSELQRRTACHPGKVWFRPLLPQTGPVLAPNFGIQDISSRVYPSLWDILRGIQDITDVHTVSFLGSIILDLPPFRVLPFPEGAFAFEPHWGLRAAPVRSPTHEFRLNVTGIVILNPLGKHQISIFA